MRKDKGNYNSNGMLVIIDACNLDELLKRFDYDENLSFEDIKEIRKTIFNSNFLYENCNEFGLMRRLPPSNITHISTVGEPLTHYPSLVRDKLMYLFSKMLKQEGFQIFNSKSYVENYYMMKYWYAIKELGDDKLLDFFSKGFDINLDAFRPAKIEGPVKKLIK